MTLVILEDNADRRETMVKVLDEHGINLAREFFPSAPEFIRWMRENPGVAKVISLDHDLEQQEGATEDPGTGRDVVNWLIAENVRLPTIIHSSNQNAAEGMKYALRDNQVPVRRVAPYNDLDWIGERWITVLEKLI